ncbi:MAG: deoxyribose-phosphate aldolase [Phycisphaerales bacterium]|nr:deoxyribose-phosphate aldolase [Phycisphaerales bacterium]MCB9836561.1 deoxyribose-phosphate aldolase [Phycisphaera sp.]
MPKALIPPSPTVDAIMATERAKSFTTRSIKKESKEQALKLALSMVDLTTLEGKDSPEKVRSICRKAVTPMPGHPDIPSVAAVCFYPSMVKVAAEALKGTGVKIASVATGFPSGQYPLDVRLRDTEKAIEDGADEIDMVINRGAFLAGQRDVVYDEILAVSRLCRDAWSGDRHVHLKVILETGELETLDNVRLASDIAIAAMLEANLLDEQGGGFIKTSTGKVSPAATMPVTLVMLEAIRDAHRREGVFVGMKPAGGIRTAKEAWHYLCMVKETLEGVDSHTGCHWLSPHLFRFGASSLANDLLRQLAHLRTGVYAAGYDFAEA